MSDHEFEKQVRQKLSDLKIKPSPAAWEHIAGQIQTRPRRRPWIWLGLLTAGLLVGGYLVQGPLTQSVLADQEKSRPENADPARTKNRAGDPLAEGASANAANERNGSGEHIADPAEIPAGSGTGSKGAEKTSSRSAASGDGPNQRVEIAKAKEGASTGSSDAGRNSRETHSLVQEVQRGLKPVIGARNEAPGNIAGVAGMNKDIEKNEVPILRPFVRIPAKAGIIGPVSVAGVFGPFSAGLALSDLALTAEEPALPDPGRSSSSKWTYGLSLSGGVSAIQEGRLMDLSRPLVEDVSFVPTLGSPSAAFAPPYTPSTIAPGHSFGAGAWLRRELSDRFAVSAGLRYLQFNTLTKVGRPGTGAQVVNNGQRGFITVASYFQIDQDIKSEYRNKYHFLEIPLLLHTRLNPGAGVPLSLNLGMAFSGMLRSNSLHFDGTTGVYYHDDGLLNRNQASAVVGFSLGMRQGSKLPLELGPSVRYHLSRMMDRDVPTRKRFIAAEMEIRARLN